MKNNRYLAAILALLMGALFSTPAFATDPGYFIRNGTSSLTPVSGQTVVMDYSGPVPLLKVYSGSSYIQVSQQYSNYAATAAPGVGNDNTQGYQIGSIWWDTVGLQGYICVSAVTSAASWNPVTGRVGATDIAPKLTMADCMADFLVSGIIGSVPGSSLSMTTPTGVAYVGGVRVVTTSTSHTYAINQDAYVYLQANGTYIYPAVANLASPPTGQPGLLIEKVVTNGTVITGVTQLAASAPVVAVGNATTTTQALNESVANGLYSPLFSGSSNQFVATPYGGSGAVALRTIGVNDLPVIPLSLGGLGASITPTANTILYFNGTGFSQIAAPTISGTGLTWNGSTFGYTASPGASTVTANLGFRGPASGSAALPTFRADVDADLPQDAVVFGGPPTATYRQLPTSGTLTGEYWFAGNWSSSGAITCNRCNWHISGNMNLAHNIVINPELAGGGSGIGAGVGTGGQNGYGYGGGQGAVALNGVTADVGGAGGGAGGIGGQGGIPSAMAAVARGGSNYFADQQLRGSGGGGGTNGNGASGSSGGQGGGGFRCDVGGNIALTSACTIFAQGNQGGSGGVSGMPGGGGGSGGVLDMRCNGTFNFTGCTINAAGFPGGNGGGGASDPGGGGGAGGIIFIRSGGTYTAGTTVVTGGAAGTSGGSVTTLPTAGGVGVVDASGGVPWGIRL